MKLENFKKLFNVRNRTGLAFFGLLGAVLYLLARMMIGQSLFSGPTCSGIFDQFAVVLIGVSLVEIVWKFLGGDPVEDQLNAGFEKTAVKAAATEQSILHKLDTVDAKVAALAEAAHTSTTVLADINQFHLGIERAWPTRREWMNDPHDGPAVWQQRQSTAKEIDIVSNTLWTSWFRDGKTRQEFFDNITRGARVRILIYHPQALLLVLRAANEISLNPKKSADLRAAEVANSFNEMRQEITSTLLSLAINRQNLSEAACKNLQVRLNTGYYHLAQIVRADDRMLITSYLAGKTGTPSPVMQIRGAHTAYYESHRSQWETLWESGLELDEACFDIIIKNEGRLAFDAKADLLYKLLLPQWPKARESKGDTL
ncbi:MAG: hypothetical protein ACOYYS_09045 [Chloroflexota bacterium]